MQTQTRKGTKSDLDGGEHLLVCALEHPPAAHGEQGVADKRLAQGWEVKSDVPLGVASHVDDSSLQCPQSDHPTPTNSHVNPGNFVGFALRAHYLTARCVLQLFVAAGMIVVVVRVPDLRQFPATARKSLHVGIGVGRVDCRRLPGDRIVNQIPVIVLTH